MWLQFSLLQAKVQGVLVPLSDIPSVHQLDEIIKVCRSLPVVYGGILIVAVVVLQNPIRGAQYFIFGELCSHKTCH